MQNLPKPPLPLLLAVGLIGLMGLLSRLRRSEEPTEPEPKVTHPRLESEAVTAAERRRVMSELGKKSGEARRKRAQELSL
jgi:hypothetical protein